MDEHTDASRSSGPDIGQPRMFRVPGAPEPVRLPWTWATAQLVQAHTYWIATTRADGRPHSRPVWGIWRDETFYFNTVSLAVRNLAANPAITVHLESGSSVVIIEGRAEQVNDPSLAEQLVALFSQKYSGIVEQNWLSEPFFAVHPHLAFGWLADVSGHDGGAYFQGTATRWRFSSSPVKDLSSNNGVP